MTRRRAVVVTTGLVAAAVAAGGLAVAASQPPVASVKACAKKGVLVAPVKGACPKGTSRLTLSATGPQGPAGPSGPAGPTGAVGSPGPAGSTAAASVQYVDANGRQVGRLISVAYDVVLINGYLWVVSPAGGTFTPTSTGNVFFASTGCTGTPLIASDAFGAQGTHVGYGGSVLVTTGPSSSQTYNSYGSGSTCTNSNGTADLAQAGPVPSTPPGVPGPLTLR